MSCKQLAMLHVSVFLGLRLALVDLPRARAQAIATGAILGTITAQSRALVPDAEVSVVKMRLWR
jgi:hypothetical protein